MSEDQDGPAELPVEDLDDLYENAPCGYFSLSRDGLIIKVNRTFCEWTGLQKDQILGRRLRDLLSVGGRIFYETHFAPLLRMQGYFNEVALDVLTADGAKLPVLANASERRLPDGELLFTRVTIFLATERRRYERELVEARTTADTTNRELAAGWTAEKQTSELREQFIAILGHDLRNPVAAIDAGTKLLLRQNPGEGARNILALIQSATLRMNALISNVLDFARGRLGGGLGIALEQGRPLVPTLEQVVSEFRTSTPRFRIEEHYAVDVPVAVDHGRIAQLFANLLGNAIAHGDADQIVRIEATAEGGVLQIAVANGGSAIPDEVMQHLFKPFYRGEVRPNLQGLGLGLYIASEIAKAHGGRIDVVSDASGTRFTFVMPMRNDGNSVELDERTEGI